MMETKMLLFVRFWSWIYIAVCVLGVVVCVLDIFSPHHYTFKDGNLYERKPIAGVINYGLRLLILGSVMYFLLY